MSKKKIFIIGFNKCGTRTLSEYFDTQGLDAYHVGNDFYSFSCQLTDNMAHRKKILDTYEHDVYSDHAFLPRYYKRLDEDYPDSLFILNTRDVDDWLISRLNHHWCSMVPAYNIRYGHRKWNWRQSITDWRMQWLDHHKDVTEYFSDRPNDLLVFDIDNDGVQKIIDFCAPTYSFNEAGWGHLGETVKRQDLYFAKNNGRIVNVKRPPDRAYTKAFDPWHIELKMVVANMHPSHLASDPEEES